MGDRRVGDRREKEKGVIKLKFGEAMIYLISAIVIIASVSLNIILLRENKAYKNYVETYELFTAEEYSLDSENGR